MPLPADFLDALDDEATELDSITDNLGEEDEYVPDFFPSTILMRW